MARHSLEEFLALKLPERVRIILDSQTVFLLRSKTLEKRAALAALKDWQVPGRGAS